MKKNLIYIIAVVIFVLVAGGSYLLFSKTGNKIMQPPVPEVKQLSNGSLQFDQSLPKTQPCPLNGIKYSTQQEAWWQ
ncbi:MAG TPA: hypothetical protein VF820_04935, partial [Patescibacteria group bacterium]